MTDHDPTPEQTHRAARLCGLFFIVTFVTSIPALLLYDPVLHDARYVLGGGADDQVFLAAALELLLIVANIASAVVLYPILRRQHAGAALGFITARVMESAFIAVGILAVLSVVTLRQDAVGDPGTRLAVADAMVAVKDWTFLLGPGFVVGIGNGLLLGYLLYRSGLVPRRMALLGLVGGPLVCASGIAVMFGVLEQGGAGQFIATIPEIAWEASLGIYLTVMGARRSSLPGRAPALVTA
jgi:hypothetical protein